ncbi:CDP-glycerol glycerophosphotransferase family protein [Vibrio chagasii]|uniref:CDP-glycerol glycerophosphotransferase family protein n=1 Tax=Vibrio chagasii TaxID=170679 RepID=UPI0021B21692|nr:CDP-glycerol glycerophosphotransferase family protein [Vibrio chagasii]
MRRIKIFVLLISSKLPKFDLFLRKSQVLIYNLMFLIKKKKAIDEKKIIFECFKGKFVNDSPYALYSELQLTHEANDYKYVWVLSDASHQMRTSLERNPNTSVVIYGTDEYYSAYESSSYWFTNCRLSYRIFKRAGQKYIQCWHGTPLKKMGHDIVTGNNAKVSLGGLKAAYSREAKLLDLFLSPSPYASERFCSSFNMPQSKILEKGYPRNDFLVKNKRDNEKIIQLKKKYGIGLDVKVVLYTPTWRDDQYSLANSSHLGVNYLDNEEFMARFKDTIFLYRGHYFTKSSINKDRFLDVSHVNDVNELYLISDLLVTDYSSTFFDYALLDKPILFYMPDLEHYMNKTRGFYLNIDFELPGNITTDLSSLASDIIHYLDLGDNHQEFNKKFNPYETGNSSNHILKHLGLI